VKANDIDTNTWGPHARKTGDADTLLLEENRIAVDWVKRGDLASLKAP
jgi:hypothetical protein